MARGWESKSVEAGQEADRSQPTAAPGSNHAHDAARQRRVQELLLQRERMASERTANPHRRAALVAALADIEAQLAELGFNEAGG